MKKILSIVMSLCMLLSITAGLNLTANAESYSGTCGDNVTWTFETDSGLLHIYGTGKMNDYSSYGGTPWEQKDLIETVVIDQGVTYIGNYAFYDCDALVEVIIPDSVTYIGKAAFYHCDSLKNLPIANGITTISSNTYSFCSGLTSVVIPDNITHIENNAFSNCKNISNISISKNIVNIGYNVFYGTAYYDNEINWENNALYVDGCLIEVEGYKNESFSVKEGTRLIASRVFDENNAELIKRLYFPATMKYISDNAFWRTSLEKINVNEENKYFSSIDGVLFNKDKTSIILYPFKKQNDMYIVPDGVNSINSYCFANCDVASLSLPSTIKEIGSFAFFDSSLSEINIPEGISIIKEGTFYGSKISNIVLPDSITTIDYNAFRFCSDLKSISFSKNLKTIGNYAFFSDGDGITDVYYSGTKVDWENIDLGYANNGLTDATIHCIDGDIKKMPETPEEPTEPSTEPSTEPTTAPITQPTTQPTAPVTQPTTASTTTTTTTTTTVPTVVPDAQPVAVTQAAPAGATKVNGEWIAFKQKNTKVKKVTKAKKSFKATWSKVTGVAGYQVQYSTDKKFKKNTKSVTVKGNKTTSTTVKKLKAKQKYFVRIRTYKNVKLNGKTVKVYSKWSSAKTVTTK